MFHRFTCVISIFGDGLAGCFVFGLFGLCLCFLFGCFVWVASPTCEIFYFF